MTHARVPVDASGNGRLVARHGRRGTILLASRGNALGDGYRVGERGSSFVGSRGVLFRVRDGGKEKVRAVP